MLATLEAKLITGAIGFVLIFAGLFTVYEYGKHAQKQSDQIIFDKMKEAALVQQVAAKQTEIAQNENTDQVAESYSAELDRLDAALSVRQPVARAGHAVRAAALGTGGAHAAQPEFGSTCTRAFFSAGLQDSLTLTAWQQWATEQKLPVH